jgi:hypothetical protein
MKLFFSFLGLLLGLLGALNTHAQTACPTPPPAGCPQPFRVVDAGTGLEITVLQVGCPVRFEQNCGRVTAPALLYYQVVPGTNAIPVNCLPTTTAGVNTYTPTVADVGPVTVFELSNPSSGSGGSGVAYIRNYTVVNPTPPAFTVAACAGNTALVTLTSPVYSSYTVQVNGGAAQPLVSPQQVNITAGGANTFVITGNPGSSCPQSATQTITLPVAQTPVFTRLTRTGTAATGGGAQLDFDQVPAGFTYALQIENPAAPGTYTTVAGATITPATGNAATATLPRPRAATACCAPMPAAIPRPPIRLARWAWAALPAMAAIRSPWRLLGPPMLRAIPSPAAPAALPFRYPPRPPATTMRRCSAAPPTPTASRPR